MQQWGNLQRSTRITYLKQTSWAQWCFETVLYNFKTLCRLLNYTISVTTQLWLYQTVVRQMRQKKSQWSTYEFGSSSLATEKPTFSTIWRTATGIVNTMYTIYVMPHITHFTSSVMCTLHPQLPSSLRFAVSEHIHRIFSLSLHFFEDTDICQQQILTTHLSSTNSITIIDHSYKAPFSH